MLSQSFRLKTSFLAACILFQCAVAGNAYAQEGQPEIAGGNPILVKTESAAVHDFIINTENLNHPQDLKRYLEQQCDKYRKLPEFNGHLCAIGMWKDKEMVPHVPNYQMNDEQAKAEVASYLRNFTNGLSELSLLNNENVTSKY